MAPPRVNIYVTSLTSQPKVRQHIELLRRSLRGLEIPYEEHDLVIDEDAKKKWQRSKPPGVVVGLPGYLVGGEWVGTMDDFEDAVETQTLPQFLKQDLDLSSNPAASATTPGGGSSAAPAADVGNASSGAGPGGPQKSMQEVELESLMREMTEADLDQLMGELEVNAKPKPEETKTGLLDGGLSVGAGAGLGKNDELVEKNGGISDVKETEKGLLSDLKKELDMDDREDVELRRASPLPPSQDRDQTESAGAGAEAGANAEPHTSTSKVTTAEQKEAKDGSALKGGLGQGISSLVDESDVLSDLKKELKFDQNEDRDLEVLEDGTPSANTDGAKEKEKVD